MNMLGRYILFGSAAVIFAPSPIYAQMELDGGAHSPVSQTRNYSYTCASNLKDSLQLVQNQGRYPVLTNLEHNGHSISAVERQYINNELQHLSYVGDITLQCLPGGVSKYLMSARTAWGEKNSTARVKMVITIRISDTGRVSLEK